MKKILFLAALAAVAALSTGCNNDDSKDEPQADGFKTTTTVQCTCGQTTYYVKCTNQNKLNAGGVYFDSKRNLYHDDGSLFGWTLRVNDKDGAYHGFWVNVDNISKIWWTCDSCDTTITAEWDGNEIVCH